jgi:hypothetical protein
MGKVKNPSYGSSHLYLSAFLCCQGHELIGTELDATGRILFLFLDTDALRSSVAEFMRGGLVDARQFAFMLLRLKKCFPRLTVETNRQCLPTHPKIEGDPNLLVK